MDFGSFLNVWPEDLSTFFTIKLNEAQTLLRDQFSIDFNQPIDRLDAQQLYSSGLFLILVCLGGIILLHYIVYNFISNPIAHSLFKLPNLKKGKSPQQDSRSTTSPSKGKIRLRSIPSSEALNKAEHEKASLNIIKFNIAFWKAINYGFLFLYGINFCFFQEDGGWIYNYRTYAAPLRYYSWPLAIYYHLSLAHYLYGFVCLLYEPKLKDFNQMLVHHIATLGLESGSYYLSGAVHVGAAVMLLHDASDPLMESAKIFLYCGYEFFANLFFAMFASVFIISRDFLYPIYVIAPLIYADEVRGVYLLNLYTALLSTIFVLNLFWSYLILVMVQRHILGYKVQGDIREE